VGVSEDCSEKCRSSTCESNDPFTTERSESGTVASQPDRREGFDSEAPAGRSESESSESRVSSWKAASETETVVRGTAAPMRLGSRGMAEGASRAATKPETLNSDRGRERSNDNPKGDICEPVFFIRLDFARILGEK
jgi:hypothetical protein